MTIEKHSLSLSGHRTSVSLEAPFWRAFREIAAARGMPVAALVREIDEGRLASMPAGAPYNLSSAIRVFVLDDLERRLREASAQRCPDRRSQGRDDGCCALAQGRLPGLHRGRQIFREA